MLRNSLIFLMRGGLGNQLFQLCALGQLSKCLDIRFYISDINTHALTRGSGGTESLKLDFYSLFDPTKLPRIMAPRSRSLVKYLLAINKYTSFPRLIYTDTVDNLSIGHSLMMQGYFQDFKIPASYDLRALNTLIFGRNDALKNKRIKEIACVHVRRSDYPSSGISNFGWDYYSNSITKMIARGIKEFDCYSDDISEAKKMFPKNDKIRVNFPELESRLNSVELLRAMAAYDHNITSQSSLSWWSSYIAFRNNPKVVIESNWNSGLDFLMSPTS